VDVAKRTVRATLTGHGSTAEALAFSPDGRVLAAACGPTLVVWDVATGQVLVRHTADRQYCKDVAFTPDGRFLLLARNDETVRVLSTAGWKEHTTFRWELGKMVSLAIDPTGMRAAAGSDKGKIVVWDLDL
jgi:WD40 repeat protein